MESLCAQKKDIADKREISEHRKTRKYDYRVSGVLSVLTFSPSTHV